MILIMLLIAGITSYQLTAIIYYYAIKHRLIDQPNHRSAHYLPTPRGGGLAVVIVFLFGLIVLKFTQLIQLDDGSLNGIIIGSLLISSIGLIDDYYSISARLRFVIHILAVGIGLSYLPTLAYIPIFEFNISLSGWGWFMDLFGLVWLLNLYNFVDGIDGFAALEAILVSLSAAVLLALQQQSDLIGLPLLLAAAVTGFLPWNWSPAKIFMGDIGSGFLGFIFGMMAMITALNHKINLWCWGILLAVFITDATITLIQRMLNGEIWHQAHSNHAYQHYTRKLIHKFNAQGVEMLQARSYAHRRVNYGLLMIHFFWLLPLAILANFYVYWAFIISIIAFIPLIVAAYYAKAGLNN
jgi:Fuc2NAc and GlcNAc transferase